MSTMVPASTSLQTHKAFQKMGGGRATGRQNLLLAALFHIKRLRESGGLVSSRAFLSQCMVLFSLQDFLCPRICEEASGSAILRQPFRGDTQHPLSKFKRCPRAQKDWEPQTRYIFILPFLKAAQGCIYGSPLLHFVFTTTLQSWSVNGPWSPKQTSQWESEPRSARTQLNMPTPPKISIWQEASHQREFHKMAHRTPASSV